MTTLPTCGYRPYSVPAQQSESLPFRVRLARDETDLAKLIKLRSEVYDRHVPGMAKVLAEPEEDDFRSDVAIVIAECKSSHQILGSMRLVSNLSRALHLETDIRLPMQFSGKKMLEAWRLTVRPGEAGKMVSSALYKALYEISFACGIDHVLVVARRPVDRLYQMMQFIEVNIGQKILLSNTLNLPHSLYHLPVKEADRLWRDAQCPLYPFMAMTTHPDLELNHHEVLDKFLSSQAVEQGCCI